ncbi:MAG TPA: phage tail tape measure protein, partial [bacterium]|nr:phage tail tape measure protein [bacterium]
MLGSLGNMGGVGSIVAVVGIAGLDKFEQDLGKMAKAVDGQAQFMHKSMTAAAAAGAVMFAASIKAASDFESSFAGVTKTIDGISDDFGNLNAEGKALAQKFRDLSLEIPISVNELNKIAEMGGALGVPKDDIEGFTKAIANLGTTTDLTTEAGAEAIAKFINVTTQVAPAGMSMAEQTERIGSTLVDLGNKTAATESAIAAMAQRLAGAGAQVNLSQAEILGMSAALSSVGIEAEMGGSAMSKFIMEVSTQVETGGNKLDDFARIANMSVADFTRAFREDAAGAIGAFLSGLNKTQSSGQSLFPVLKDLGIEEVRMRDTILRLAGASDLFNQSLDYGRSAYEANTAMTIEAQKRYATFESQVTLLKNQFNDTAISIGKAIVPALNEMLKSVNAHPESFKALAGAIATATLALGAAALGLKTYKTAAELAKLANVTLAGSLGPIAAVAAAIGVVTVAYGAMKDAQEKQTQKAVDQIGAMGKEVEQAESLGRTIEKLRGKKNLNITETINLRDAEEKYAAMLRSVGLDVTSFSGKIDEQTKAFKRLREQQLLKMREDLDAQVRDLAQTTGFVDFFSDAWGNFTNKMGGINKQIEAINTELNDLQGPVSLVTTGVTDLGNAASG